MPPVTHPLQRFLERITSDTLKEHGGKVSIGGRNTCITVLRFTDDVDVLVKEEQK